MPVGTLLQSIFLTTGQAAEIAGVNRLTIRRWVQHGRLRAEKVGDFILVYRTAVLNLAAGQEQANADDE